MSLLKQDMWTIHDLGDWQLSQEEGVIQHEGQMTALVKTFNTAPTFTE